MRYTASHSAQYDSPHSSHVDTASSSSQFAHCSRPSDTELDELRRRTDNEAYSGGSAVECWNEVELLRSAGWDSAGGAACIDTALRRFSTGGAGGGCGDEAATINSPEAL